MAIIVRPATTGFTIKEVDGSPSVSAPSVLQVPNGSLTNNGGGNLTFTPSGGGGVVKQFYVKPTPYAIPGTNTTRGLTAAALGILFEVSSAGHINGVGFMPTNTTGTVRAAIFGPVVTKDVLDGAALLVESAAVALSTAGTDQIIPLSSTAIAAGQYFMMLQFSVSGSGFKNYDSNGFGVPTWRPYFAQAFGAYPATAPTTSTDNGDIPYMYAALTGA